MTADARLAHIAMAPIRLAQPIAELRLIAIERIITAHADEAFGSLLR